MLFAEKLYPSVFRKPSPQSDGFIQFTPKLMALRPSIPGSHNCKFWYQYFTGARFQLWQDVHCNRTRSNLHHSLWNNIDQAQLGPYILRSMAEKEAWLNVLHTNRGIGECIECVDLEVFHSRGEHLAPPSKGSVWSFLGASSSGCSYRRNLTVHSPVHRHSLV